MTPTLLSASRVVGTPFDSVLIEGGRIAKVGWATDLRQKAGRHIHHDAAVITPGLIDAHFHPLGYAASQVGLNLDDAADFDDLAGRLRSTAAELAPDLAVIGLRLNDENLAERRLPNRYDLDSWIADRPVLLYRICGHIAVANSKALEKVGPSERDPSGGSFDRDEGGIPNGIVREEAVQVLSARLAPQTSNLSPTDLLAAMHGLTQLGITGLGAIVSTGEPIWCGMGDELTTLLAIAPDLPLDVRVLVITDSAKDLEYAARRLDHSGPHLSFLGWKAFSDGSLGGHTAAMHEPFTDRPATRGTVRLQTDPALNLVRAAQDLGGWAAVHAIGDRANDLVLDMFDEAIGRGADSARLRIEHASVLSPKAIARMSQLGVVASVQPAFVASEQDWMEKRLGPDRVLMTYPFRSMLEAGVDLAGGSDCPVEPPSPWRGMAAACRRGRLNHAEELTPSEAFEMFTSGAALATGEKPPFTPGVPANLLVCDRDPTTSPDFESVRVLERWFWGEPQ